LGGSLLEVPIHPTYKPGVPYIARDVIDVSNEISIAIASLDKHYMDNFKKLESEK
jgi:hypothetical protein